MDSSTPAQPSEQQVGQLTCTQCGKRFRFKANLAGRSVNCPCGARIIVPRVQFTASALQAAAAQAPPAAPSVGLAARPGAADEPFDVDDDTPAPPKTIHVAHLPPQHRGLKQEERQPAEALFQPSTLRDWIIPSILIAIGIALRFVEAMAPWAVQDPLPAGEALAAVAFKLLLSVGLMLGGMALAVNVMEICFLGPLSRTAYKLIAIGVAPGALYGILSFAGGEPYGAMIGTFVSILAYGVLFWSLMRLDLKETAMVVLLTWILVTAANYIAYKAQGLMTDSWV